VGNDYKINDPNRLLMELSRIPFFKILYHLPAHDLAFVGNGVADTLGPI